MEPAGQMTSAKLLKTWWPGTELNRRQHFSGLDTPIRKQLKTWGLSPKMTIFQG